MVILGRNVLFANKALRTTFLAFYVIALIPFLNAFLFLAIIALAFSAITFIFDTALVLYRCHIRRIPRSPSDVSISHPRVIAKRCIATLVLVFGVQTILVVDTELFIVRNKRLLPPGESEWTFGQTLAMILVYIPLNNVFWYLYGHHGRYFSWLRLVLNGFGLLPNYFSGRERRRQAFPRNDAMDNPIMIPLQVLHHRDHDSEGPQPGPAVDPISTSLA